METGDLKHAVDVVMWPWQETSTCPPTAEGVEAVGAQPLCTEEADVKEANNGDAEATKPNDAGVSPEIDESMSSAKPLGGAQPGNAPTARQAGCFHSR
jgi:hypothetical protein